MPDQKKNDRRSVFIKGVGNYARKARFNERRDSYLDDSGSYVYITDSGKKYVIPNDGQYGDVIIMLDTFDHEENLSDDRFYDVADHYTSAEDLERAANGENSESGVVSTARASAIVTRAPSIHDQAFPEPGEPSIKEKIIRSAIEQCPERWQNMFYGVYGENLSMEAYRQREVQEEGQEKGLAAVSKVDTKMKKRVCDALGVPMPAKKRGRKG